MVPILPTLVCLLNEDEDSEVSSSRNSSQAGSEAESETVPDKTCEQKEEKLYRRRPKT